MWLARRLTGAGPVRREPGWMHEPCGSALSKHCRKKGAFSWGSEILFSPQ